MKDQEAAKGYQKGVFTKKVKQANEIYRELQQQIRDLGDKLNLSIDTEMFEEIVPQGLAIKEVEGLWKRFFFHLIGIGGIFFCILSGLEDFFYLFYQDWRDFILC